MKDLLEVHAPAAISEEFITALNGYSVQAARAVFLHCRDSFHLFILVMSDEWHT
jgi:hypothetical protein